MSDDIERFAAQLEAAPQKVSRQVRGIMAKHLDAAAGQARQAYLASRGGGSSESAGTIRARMSASIGRRGGNRQVGYLLADGPGVFFHEHGHGHVPPNPVVRMAAERVPAAMASEILDIMVDP